MGASEWRYFVPYQPNIQKAFDDLQAEVFEKLNYDNDRTIPFEVLQQGFAIIYSADSRLTETERIEARDALYAPYLNPKGVPLYHSIVEMREASGEDGTHSILDMEGVSDEKDNGICAPLSKIVLEAYFGTDQPTRTMIDDAFTRRIPFNYWDYDIPLEALPLSHYIDRAGDRGRWQGTYIVIYRDGQPDEILFTGYSGD